MKRATWMFLTAGAAAACAVRLLPGQRPGAFTIDALELLAAAAVLVGVHHNHPRHPRAWHLLATGVFLLAAGDLLWDVVDAALPASGLALTISNVVYLGAYPFLLAGLLVLARARSTGGNRQALADAAIITAAALIPVWQYLVVPVSGASVSTFDKASAVLYPLLDLVLVAALARVLFTRRTRAPSYWLLFAALMTTLAGDVAYARVLPTDIVPTSVWLDQVWPISYLLIAAAALHPSMRMLSEQSGPGVSNLPRTRIALLASALLVGPVVDNTTHLHHNDMEPRVFGLVSLLVTGLVIWRLTTLNHATSRAARSLEESEQRFRSLVQHASDVIGVAGADGTIEYVSPAITSLLGYAPEDFLGTKVTEHLHPDDVSHATAAYAEALANPGEAFVFQMRGRHRDGSWRWIETSCTSRLDEPSVDGVVGNFHDLTERIRAERTLAGESRVLELIARSAPLQETLDAIASTIDEQLESGNCMIVLGDEAAVHTIAAPGLSASFLQAIAIAGRGSDPHELGIRPSWSTPITATDTARALGRFAVYSSEASAPGGHERALVEQFVSLAAIAFDRSAAEDHLEFLALHDSLTQLPNRALVLDRLHQALLRTARHQSTVAVLFLDLDRFKVINDSLGHRAGDELLVAVGHRIREIIRPGDTVARLGGDEFVVVCEDISGDHEAIELANRVERALARPFTLAQGEVVVSASIGIAVSHDAQVEPDALLSDADSAMYRAKDRGRARYELFDEELRSRAVLRLATERSLRRALDHDELRLFFQPQVDLRRFEIVSFEALLRWEHPTRGLLAPHDFIDVAEETGLIVPIGAWVLEAACKQAARWRGSGGGVTSAFSVNLSARQLTRRELPQLVEHTLHEHGLTPDALCLEITETVLLDDMEATGEALGALAALGVRLAIDDFGTGYSSLAYLKRFPFHQLKVDRSFVDGLGTDDTDDAIVTATIEMAHALGMEVAAEGVETELQLRRLRQLGCDLAQGFLFAIPQPGDALRPTLAGSDADRRPA